MRRRKNVLFVIIDQLRADCVYGALAEKISIPNIRALMDEAVSFTGIIPSPALAAPPAHRFSPAVMR